MTREVSVYVAQGCHLCDAALEVVRAAGEEHAFALRVVDITGDPDLESSYRRFVPVIEIDGARAFTYHVHPDALRDRLFDAG